MYRRGALEAKRPHRSCPQLLIRTSCTASHFDSQPRNTRSDAGSRHAKCVVVVVLFCTWVVNTMQENIAVQRP